MTRLNVTDARCVALFASGLQRSDAPAANAPATEVLAADVLAEVIRRTVRRFGVAGCASRMAQEFGDHPESAASRMQWIRQLVSETSGPAASRPVRAAGRPAVPGSSRRAPWPAMGAPRHAA